ncbi:phosphopantetheine adenylyltransferase [Limnohabitans sp.]|uniref:phosphopantetheine adenylyltransferase n=1 Tax=Limnohabitans sp. TaxID=1907725 RepID=UPI00333E5B7C
MTKLLEYGSTIALLVSGIIHLIPVYGVSGSAALTQLYGIEVVDSNVAILLQHRALLFGILGLLMLLAIALPSIRITVLVTGLLSAASFIVVAMWVGDYNPAISRVIRADAVASALLAAGLLTEWHFAYGTR